MSIRYWLFVMLTLTLTGFIAYGTYSTARLLKSWRPDRNLLLIPAENVVRVGMIGACIGLGVLSGLPAAKLGWVWPQESSQLIRQMLAGVGWGLALALLFYLVTRWVTARTGERFYSDVVIAYIVPANRREFLLIGLVMVSVALLEELLFRSLLIGGFMPIAPAWVLVLGVGLLFGLMHSPQGLVGIVGAGLAGMIFGALFLFSEGLLLPLVAHYVANMAQVGMAMRIRDDLAVNT